MLTLRKPTLELIRRFCEQQSRLDFSYAAVGATARAHPPGFARNHTRVRLGTGKQVFEAARQALRDWRQFRLSWVEVWPPAAPLEAGAVVAVLARLGCFWWLNSCRIVYAVDEAGPIHRFGFAYGTLPAHAARGEERFLIEWNRNDDSVWFEILAYSQPNHFLTRVAYPWVRLTQRRFGREAVAAVRAAVVPAARD
jgi:uncharacterized protein (UPF0548 family)